MLKCPTKTVHLLLTWVKRSDILWQFPVTENSWREKSIQLVCSNCWVASKAAAAQSVSCTHNTDINKDSTYIYQHKNIHQNPTFISDILVKKWSKKTRITDSEVLLDKPEEGWYEASTNDNKSLHCCASVQWTAALLSQYSGRYLCVASKVVEQLVQAKLQLIVILTHQSKYKKQDFNGHPLPDLKSHNDKITADCYFGMCQKLHYMVQENVIVSSMIASSCCMLIPSSGIQESSWQTQCYVIRGTQTLYVDS